MDPQTIAQQLASGDPEQVRAAQQQLQALGYDVNPDGKLGPNTSAAMAKYREDYQSNQETVRDTAEANREANDPVNKLLGLGVDVLPYATGVGAGTSLGRWGFGKPYERADERIGREATALSRAQDIDPGEKRSQLNRMLRRRAVRNTAQFGAPALLAGGGYVTQEYIAPRVPEELQGAVRMVGTGENAAAATLGVHQIVDTLRRGNPVSNVDEARIRSQANQATQAVPARPTRPVQSVQTEAAPQPRPAQPAITQQRALPAPAEPPAEPMRHSDRLRQTAVAAGAKPATKKSANVAAIRRNLTPDNMPAVAESLALSRDATRPQILQRLREISKVGGKLVLPLTAGAMAYDAATSQAEAAGIGPSGQVASGIGAGATGAGLYEGGRRVWNRLMQAAPNVMRSVGGGAAMSLPGEIADATTQTPEQLAMARNKAARYLPEFMQVGAVGEAAEMAQVPERGERGLLGRRDMNAADLEIPQDIPTEPAPGMDGEEPMDFNQYLADLQMIMREIGQDQRPAPRRPGPVAPSAPRNRLMTAY